MHRSSPLPKKVLQNDLIRVNLKACLTNKENKRIRGSQKDQTCCLVYISKATAGLGPNIQVHPPKTTTTTTALPVSPCRSADASEPDKLFEGFFGSEKCQALVLNSCLRLTCLVPVFILWGIQSDVSASLCSLDFEKVAHLLLSDTNLVYLPVFTTVGESLYKQTH